MKTKAASVAQTEERLTCTQDVAGATPATSFTITEVTRQRSMLALAEMRNSVLSYSLPSSMIKVWISEIDEALTELGYYKNGGYNGRV